VLISLFTYFGIWDALTMGKGVEIMRKRNWTYNYGTGNVGDAHTTSLLATLEHVQERDSKRSYYYLRLNRFNSDTVKRTHATDIGFPTIEYAFEYLDKVFGV
jgi:hypothetical protein